MALGEAEAQWVYVRCKLTYSLEGHPICGKPPHVQYRSETIPSGRLPSDFMVPEREVLFAAYDSPRELSSMQDL
jgi:hypothetical protein